MPANVWKTGPKFCLPIFRAVHSTYFQQLAYLKGYTPWLLQLLYLPGCLKWVVSSLGIVVAFVMCKLFLVLEECTCKGCRIYMDFIFKVGTGRLTEGQVSQWSEVSIKASYQQSSGPVMNTLHLQHQLFRLYLWDLRFLEIKKYSE